MQFKPILGAVWDRLSQAFKIGEFCHIWVIPVLPIVIADMADVYFRVRRVGFHNNGSMKMRNI